MRDKALLYSGLVLVGIYTLWRNAARAGVAPYASPGALPYDQPSAGGIPYTPAALNAAVPGVSFAPSTAQPGILTSTLTGVPAISTTQVAQGATFWNTLQPVNPPDSGYITLPSGTQFAAASMTGGNTRMDGNGNLYVLWGDRVYQLGAQDSAGDWPALVVTS